MRKQRLLGMTENYIKGSDYAVICDESGVTDQGDLRKGLLNWFNDLGISICYGGNVRLRDYVILRPNWITNAVYAILFNKHTDTQNGIISHDAIFEMIQPTGAGADPYRRTNSAEKYTQAFDYDELVESLDHGETTRYSRAHKRRLEIEDILNQTGHRPSEAREKLVEDLVTVCAQMQANSNNWNTYEDNRNTYIRDLLRAKGYLVADQTFSGVAAGGKRAGELDLLILDGPDRPWTLCEAMNLSGKGQGQIEYWDAHLQKLLGCYDANGMPFLFLISYVDCGAEKFGQIAAAYYEHLRFYSPGGYGLQSAETLSVGSPRRQQNQYIQTAKCIYDREGFPTTVYHIFVRMGS